MRDKNEEGKEKMERDAPPKAILKNSHDAKCLHSLALDPFCFYVVVDVHSYFLLMQVMLPIQFIEFGSNCSL